MGQIPEDTIQTIRERVDIVDLVGRQVNLKKAGRLWKGLCPFHNEKTPSFVVTPERDSYHCFGCGEGGSAFSFLMRHEGLTFPEAVRSLAAEVGVVVPERGDGQQRGVIEALLRACEEAQHFYRKSLRSDAGRGAREYLAARGLSLDDAEHHGLGFAPDSWDGLVSALRREEIPAEVGERAGLLRARDRGGHYDMLRGRLTFPIQDARGRVVAFGGRALGEGQEPKYLNTTESPNFHKRGTFYGMPQALAAIRKRGRAILVEGYFDRIALERAGRAEALATCGTALSDAHAKSLRRRTQEVVLLFDGDEAGAKATLRALELLLPEGLRVRAAALPAGVDPDDFLRIEGPDALAALIDRAPPALELAIERATKGGALTPFARADAVKAVAPLLARVRDAVERGEFTRQLAFRVGCDETEAKAAVQAALRKASRMGDGAAADEPEPALELARESAEDRHYATALRLIFVHGATCEALEQGALLEHAPDADWRALTEKLFAARGARPLVALLDELEPGLPRTRLSAILNAPRPDLDDQDAQSASRILADELAWLARRFDQREARATTQTFRQDGKDSSAFLRRKQQQIEARRSDAHIEARRGDSHRAGSRATGS